MATRRPASRLPAQNNGWSPRRRLPPAPTPAPAVSAPEPLHIEYIPIDEVYPDPRNPRDNADAIPIIAASIRAFGFRIPITIDENNVIVAGHTRVAAAKLCGYTEIPATRTTGLTQDQIDAFRLVDNKSAEISKWDTNLLAQEVTRLNGAGITWTDFGWQQAEIDCLNDMVTNDCLDTTTLPPVQVPNNSERRAPTQTRVVVGEVIFFVPNVAYRSWIEGLRTMHSFVEADIIADIKRRLAIPEA